MVLFLTLSMIAVSGQLVSAQKVEILDRNGSPLQGTLAETGQSVAIQDSLALVALYEATNGDRWFTNDGWLTDMVEFWHGVTHVWEICDADDVCEWRVRRIRIRDNNMSGELPPEIGMLDQMDRFDLIANNIYGNIPEQVAGMERLTHLYLNDNDLMSGIPPWEALVSLPNLTHLYTRGADFHGQIPPIVGEFPTLTHWQASQNPYTGEIPPEIANISTLGYMLFATPLWTGQIPEFFVELENLWFFRIRNAPFLDPGPVPEFFRDMADHIERIDLRGTRRTGQIPDWYNELYRLEYIYFGSYDELEGEIPDLSLLDNLAFMIIDECNISGPFPDWIGDMPALFQLELRGIDITGQIPNNLANAPGLRRLYLQDLALDGPLPDMRNLGSLQRLVLRDLGFDIGPIPDWIETLGGLLYIYLEDVGLTGEIPDAWGDLDGLVRLVLENNPGLTGSLPDWIIGTNQLSYVQLSNTGLDLGPEIPEYIGNWTQVERLTLGGLGFTGSIPEWMGDFPRLTILSLADNELSGEIPASFGELMVIDSLNLSNNNLSGEIPETFANLGRVGPATVLTRLYISGNPELTGPIPMNFTEWDPTTMRSFHYYDTDLCEPDDPAFRQWLETLGEEDPNPLIYRSLKGTGITCGVVSAENVEVADRMTLHQNYPNPFNPVTTIRYSVPSEAHVDLVVYDVLGQRVATLVSETVHAGSHEVHFDATRLSSGTYIYRLEAGGHSLNQSMMLVK